jgi:hypothetical protein
MPKPSKGGGRHPPARRRAGGAAQGRQQAVDAYSKVAKDAKTTLIVPSNMTEVGSLISSAMKMVQANKV